MRAPILLVLIVLYLLNLAAVLYLIRRHLQREKRMAELIAIVEEWEPRVVAAERQAMAPLN